MVRSIADRAFLPTKNLLEEVGDMMILTGKTVVSALRPPYLMAASLSRSSSLR
jgi:phospholipid/cholesterol/gamma-HCH transport system permease protein